VINRVVALFVHNNIRKILEVIEQHDCLAFVYIVHATPTNRRLLSA
jgi:hypothetical protein